MRKQVRGPVPEALAKKGMTWTRCWLKRIRSGEVKAHQFSFHAYQFEVEKLGAILLKVLKQQHQDHCSFCDKHPSGRGGSIDPEIEHFRPKSKHPALALAWGNLYFCCSYCNAAAARSLAKKTPDARQRLRPLRPDLPGYSFSTYFYWDSNGKIEVRAQPQNPGLEDAAKAVLAWYDLNDHDLVRARKRFLTELTNGKHDEESLDELPFRDLVEMYRA